MAILVAVAEAAEEAEVADEPRRSEELSLTADERSVLAEAIESEAMDATDEDESRASEKASLAAEANEEVAEETDGAAMTIE